MSTLSTAQTAEFLGVTARQVLRLAESGRLPRASAGRFERVDVEAYDESRTATAPLTGAETRLAKARAERAIRQLQVLLDQQAPAVVLDRIWSLDRDAIRARLRQLPAAAAGALAGEANPRRCQSLIQDYVRVALEELTARSHDDLPEGLADGVDLSYDQVPPVGRNLQQHRQALADARARMIVCENRLADGTDLLLDAEGRFWTDRLLVMKSSLWHAAPARVAPFAATSTDAAAIEKLLAEAVEEAIEELDQPRR